MRNILLYFYILFLCLGCSRFSQASAPAVADTIEIAYAPVPVKKTVNKKVFAHLMPWFETKQTSQTAGKWGIHWTMANQDPDIINGNGRRQVASYYYPMIGPYASGDANVIEYQLLLMKLSGIDGVFIDWPGTVNLYDYPRNLANTEKIIAALGKVGLNYAIVYEDQNINIAYNNKVITDKIAAAKNDMLYLEKNYFTNSNYEKVNGKPLLLVFGPQTFTAGGEWANIFSALITTPSFFTLWSVSAKAGNTATGEFAWINSDNTTSLYNFYGNNYPGMKISSVYPGFNAFYSKGGWSGTDFVIDAKGIANFQTTLELALQNNSNYIQLPTWNDYGEGTMIEPTVEFKYSLLTSLQQKLGVELTQSNLELVQQLYDLRTKYTGDAAVQKKLNQVFYYIVSLQINKAADLLNSIH